MNRKNKIIDKLDKNDLKTILNAIDNMLELI